MTPLQTLEIRGSEIRKRLSDIGGMSDLTEEVRSELDTLKREYQDNESKRQALIIAGDKPPTPIETRSDAQGHELRRLLARGNVGSMVDSIIASRPYEVAEDEIRQHYGLEANQVPVAMLRNWSAPSLETRAVTPAPGDVGQDQHEIIPYVFPMSVAAHLAVDMPMVPVGDSTFPVLTSTLDVGTPAEGGMHGETTGAFAADVLSPRRLQASFFYSREDRARFAGMDSALREDLSMGLSDGLNAQIVAGPDGLLGTNGLTARTGDATATATFADYRGLVYDGMTIDGRYAGMASDIRVVLGTESYNHAAAVYRSNNADDSALDSLMRVSGGVRVSAHVPDPSTNDQGVIIRKGALRDLVAPIWEGLDIVFDEVTKASTGEIVLTAYMLYQIKIIRANGFQRRTVQVA